MSKILCYSCNKNKYRILAYPSKVLPEINVMLCEACHENNFEPRWAIVISARQNGSDHVKQYVLNKKYIGDEIVASELLT